ncbi:hypothetical protein ACEWY4_009845 [Coilia grayii]|uniref:C1q domain-containing protein n=1 Tax=Coilia grayii TaxID=363190 RepID=A0ABD1K7M5_9TELE
MRCVLCLGLVWVVALLHFGTCQDSCRVQDGRPGEKGMSGRDGLIGQKGEKGEPSYFDGTDRVQGQKGDQGSKGEPGDIGMKGYPGDGGPSGPPGPPGTRGSSSGGSGTAQNKRSAFSVTLAQEAAPYNDRPLRFTTAIVNINGDFRMEEGKFACKIPGVYYFVFHAMSTQNNCVRLKSDSDTSLSFCDYNIRNGKQVVSGGTVLQLSAGQKVWLEPFKGHRDRNTPSNSKDRFFIFNGFLISPSQ